MARFIFLCGLLLAQSLYAQRASIQIDGSGSMAGFDNSDGLDALIDVLEKACEQVDIPSETAFFVSTRADTVAWHDAERFQKTKEWGGYTNLEAAFNTGYDKASIVMMLTDNVQAASDLDAKALYACFARDTVKVLRAIPLKRMFEGVLYNPLPDTEPSRLKSLNVDAEIRFQSDGRLYYKGMKGFVLYLFLTQVQYRSQYEYLVAALQEEDMEPMVMKPIDDTIILRPGLIRPPVISLEEKNQFRFNFTLESRLNHIDIEPADLEDAQVQFQVQRPQVHARKGRDRMLLEQRPLHYARITPPVLVGKLSADAEHTAVYACAVSFGPFQPSHRNFWEYLNLARIRPVPADYFFSVFMEIPPNSFRMTEAYKERYFTDQPGVLDRIYTPTDLIQYLHQQPATVVPSGGTISGVLQVAPLAGPLIAWIALCLALIGVIVSIAWIVFYPVKYRLTDSLGQDREYKERLVLGPLSKQGEVNISNAVGDEFRFGSIRRLPIFRFTFQPAKGVGVEDALGNDLLEDQKAKAGEDDEVGLSLEPKKALMLKKGDMSVTLERVGSRF